jgi:hypothetical protein
MYGERVVVCQQEKAIPCCLGAMGFGPQSKAAADQT